MMSSMSGKYLFALGLFATAVPLAGAGAVMPSGGEFAFRYEDRAAELPGAPSPIVTSLMFSPRSFAGLQAAAAKTGSPAGLYVDGMQGAATTSWETPSHSFAEGVSLRFSLPDGGYRDGSLQSVVLAGLGLFALIARQRVAALTRPLRC